MKNFWNGFYKQALPLKTLGTIQKSFSKDTGMSSLMKDLYNQATKYKSSIDRVERTSKNFYQLGRGSAKSVEGADHARRLSHDSFISNLQAVTRNAGKRGANIEKLRGPTTNRDQATELAVNIANSRRKAA